MTGPESDQNQMSRRSPRELVGALVELIERSGPGMAGLRAAFLAEDPTGSLWESTWTVLYGPEAGVQVPSTALRIRILASCGYDSRQWPDLFTTQVGASPSGSSPATPRHIPHRGALLDPGGACDAAELTALMIRAMKLYGVSYRGLEKAARKQSRDLARSTLNDVLRSGRLPGHDQLDTFLIALGIAPTDRDPWLLARDRIAIAPPAVPQPTPDTVPATEVELDAPAALDVRQRRWWTALRKRRAS